MKGDADGSIRDAFLTQITELFRGLEPGAHGRVIEEAEDGSLFGTLAAMSAAQASTPACGGNTVAAHAGHVQWFMANTNRILAGEPVQGTWDDSWAIRIVNEAEWSELRASLEAEFTTLHRSLGAGGGWTEPEHLARRLGFVTHASYHLGAIRQLYAAVRRGGPQLEAYSAS